MGRDIKATLPLIDHIGRNVSAIIGVRYSDLRVLPSGILFGKGLSLIKYMTTQNSTRCPLPQILGPMRPNYMRFASLTSVLLNPHQTT